MPDILLFGKKSGFAKAFVILLTLVILLAVQDAHALPKYGKQFIISQYNDKKIEEYDLDIASNEAEKEDYFNDFFNFEIFSLSKLKEDAFDAPAAVFVVSSEDIRRSGASTIPEALRLVPGINVARQGSHKWAVSSRGFNFQFTNKLLVLIDGRTVYTPLFSGTFWDVHDLVLEDIEKIEVIRGPGATIWGANAVNGIINIITRQAGQTQGTHISTRISDNKDRVFQTRYGSGSDEKGFYRIYAKYGKRGSFKTINDTSALDEWRNIRSGFRIDKKNIDGTEIALHGDIQQAIAENYFSIVPKLTTPFTEIQRMDKKSTTANLVARYEKPVSDNSQIFLQGYYDYNNFDITTVGRMSHTFDIDFQNIIDVNYYNQFIWGLGWRFISDDIDYDEIFVEHAIPERNSSTFSAFIQDKIGIVPDRVFLTLGSKFEHNIDTGFEWQPSAKIAYYPSDNHTYWASISRAVRTPSRSENSLTFRSVGTPAGYIAQGHAVVDYKSEELIAYELGYRTKLTTGLLLEATGFYNDYDKLRTSEIAAGSGNIISIFNLENNGYGETYGTEINAKWQANKDLELGFTYSFFKIDLHIKEGSTDGGVAGLEQGEGQSPAHQFSIKAFYNLTSDIEFDNMLYYTGNVPDVKLEGIESYLRYDARVGWKFADNFELSLVGKNLLDNTHQEFYKSLYSEAVEVGRSIELKFTVNF